MPHRVGVVGVGFGVHGHLEALSRHPEFDVVPLVSPNRASSVAKQRGIRHAFASTAELLGAISVDRIVVASPPHCHYHDVALCLNARTHDL